MLILIILPYLIIVAYIQNFEAILILRVAFPKEESFQSRVTRLGQYWQKERGVCSGFAGQQHLRIWGHVKFSRG